MKRLLAGVFALVAVGLVVAYYLMPSSEVKRERSLEKARAYISQGKINEATIEFKNAIKADSNSAEAHHEFGLALLRKKDYRSALREFRRAVYINPGFIDARFQLGILLVLSRDIPHAKEELEKIRAQDKNAIEARFLAANIAMVEKDYDKALKELQEALLKEPKKASTYNDLAFVHIARKNFKEAEGAFRKALEIEPGFTRARIALANLYFVMRDQEKAEEELILAIKADQENESLLHLLGTYYSNTRRLDEYEKLYRDLLQKKPDSLFAKKGMTELFLIKGDLKQAKAYTEDILKIQPGDTDGHYFRGRLYLLERDHQKASEYLSIVTRNAPQFAQGYYFLGLAQLQGNQIQQARASLQEAIELNPLWIQPRLALAQIYLATGDHNLAWAESKRILQAQSQNRTALLIGGAARLRKGEPEKALALFKKAREIDPKDPVAHMNIGDVYQVQKIFPAALKEYEEALKLDPEKIEALRSVVAIQLLQGNRKAAFARAEQHLGEIKNQAAVYQILGELSLEGKNYTKGIEYLGKAVESNPNLLSAYFLIANAYIVQNKLDEAIEEYQKIVQKNPRALPAYMVLGALHSQKQQHAKANEYYQKVLDINKNFAPAANNLAWNYAEYGKGSLDIALGLAQKAREFSSENPDIADTLGWIYYKKGVMYSAVSLLRESSEKLNNKNPAVLYHLGMAYYQSGETALARETLSKALEIDAGFRGAEEAKKALAAIEAKKGK